MATPKELARLGYTIEATDKASAPLRLVRDEIKQTIDAAGSGTSSLLRTSAALTAAGTGITLAGAGVAATLMKLFERGVESAHELKMVEVGANLTARAIGQLDEASIQFSNRLPGASDEYVRTAESLAKLAGEHDDLTNTIAATDTAMKLSAALHTDAAKAARLVTTAYSVLGDTTKPIGPQAQALGDQLEFVSSNYQIKNVEQFTTALSKIGPTAKALGASSAEVLTFLGALQQFDPSAALQITSQLSRIVGGRGKGARALGITVTPQTGLFGVLDQITKRIGSLPKDLQLKGAEKTLGVTGPLFLQLAKNIDAYKAKANEARNATGALDHSIKRLTTEDPKVALQILGQTVDNLGKSLGLFTVNVLMPYLDSVRGRVPAVVNFVRAHEGLIKVAVAVAAVAAGAALVVGPIIAGAGALGLLIASLPAGATLTGIFASGFSAMGTALAGLISWPVVLGAALVALATAAYLNWDKIVDAFGSSDRAKATLTAFGDWIATDFTDYVKGSFTSLGQWVATTGWDMLTKPFADGTLGAQLAGSAPESVLGPTSFDAAGKAADTARAIIDYTVGNNAPRQPGFRTLDQSGQIIQSTVNETKQFWKPAADAVVDTVSPPPVPNFITLDKSGKAVDAAIAGMRDFWSRQVLARSAAASLPSTLPESRLVAAAQPSSPGGARPSITVDYHPTITIAGTGDTEADVSSIFETEYDKLISRLETDTRRSAFAEYR